MTDFLKLKFLSSLDKVFIDEKIEDKTGIEICRGFRNQPICFQVAFRTEELLTAIPYLLKPVVKGDLAAYASVRTVGQVTSLFPADKTNYDDNYLRVEPGLFPDPIQPLYYEGCAVLYPQQLESLWIELNLPEKFPAGDHVFRIELQSEKNGDCLAMGELTVNVANFALPEQKRIHTEWFYTDCLAEQYHTKAFSEKHWKIIESYLKTAVKNGINMILTPVFTPELDTYIGGERMTTQLVEIDVRNDGSYHFDFYMLERWIDLCLKVGVKYFEIPHFFSQWGARNTPKIMARVHGRRKQLFGWNTDAMGEEYKAFLSCFLPALVAKLEEKKVADHCYFHISDEPKLNQLEHYRECRNLVAPYLKDYPVIDALSSYEFAKLGVLTNPIPSIQHIEPFIEGAVTPLWTYYSGAHGCKDYTGRYFSMPLARTRILGVQMYMYDVQGFLHWGYNFWHTYCSHDVVNPLYQTECGCFNASGDCFLVYPGVNGEAVESLRLNAMREAMEDIRMLELYETYYGKEETKKMVLEISGGALTFKEYPKNAEFFDLLKSRIVKDLEKIA